MKEEQRNREQQTASPDRANGECVLHVLKIGEEGRRLLVKSRQVARMAAGEKLHGGGSGEGLEVPVEVRLIGIAGGMSDLSEGESLVPETTYMVQPHEAAEGFG